MRIVNWTGAVCLLIATGSHAFSADLAVSPEMLRQRVERLEAEASLGLPDARLAGSRLIPLLYARLEFQPAWTSPAMVDELLAAVRGAASHGLDPRDYHLQAIESRLGGGSWPPADAATRADLELLLTDSLARLAFTLHFGKLDPTRLDPIWNLSRTWEGTEPVTLFEEVLRSKQIRDFLARAEPQMPFYDRLRDGLARYRAIAEAGGWPEVPTGEALEPGVIDARVPALRRRLEIAGDLAAGSTIVDPTLYDSTLEAAVRRFQERHGLDDDGVVGKKTLEELNVPVERRVDQLRASLERARWVFRDIEESLLVVDIAGFKLHLLRGGKEVWSTRVQVGKPYSSTPVFKAAMTYLVFNPTWTVPSGILRNEVLPAVRKDPGYLATQNMTVLSSGGSVVDPGSIEWSVPFRYTVRQEPGPGNSLGRVKFMFPNEYFVYLHDTPSKRLFDRAERAFSHGCIRVEDPLKLAGLVLAETPGWERATIDRTVESGKTTTVFLREHLTVMLLYWTAEVTEHGTVLFSRDIYDRDRAVIEGLDAPFEFSPPRGLPDELRGR
jgi:murein L,D-transpeptidase YcbB/YkuD